MSMAGGGLGGGQLMRSFRRDDSVRSQRLSPGLVGRIARFAAPYRRLLSVFLVLIVIDAAVGAANPLVYAAIIDHGILLGNSDLVVELALLLVVLAVFDAALSLGERWISRGWARGSSSTCAPGCSPTSSGCRSRSSRGPRPVRW